MGDNIVKTQLEIFKNINTCYAKNRKAWRKWLNENHQKENSVWLIIYKMKTGMPSVYYPEAVDEALCFGWIDSKANKRDEESYYQFFSKRNPKSNWSKINKEKIANLTKQGLMTTAGIEMVELSKRTGTWTALDEVEALIIPADLKKELAENKNALNHWEQFSKSAKRGILEWILTAKRPETRMKRIKETVELAAQNIKANQYTKKV